MADMIENKLWDEIQTGAGVHRCAACAPTISSSSSRLRPSQSATVAERARPTASKPAVEAVPAFLVAAILPAAVGNQ